MTSAGAKAWRRWPGCAPGDVVEETLVGFGSLAGEIARKRLVVLQDLLDGDDKLADGFFRPGEPKHWLLDQSDRQLRQLLAPFSSEPIGTLAQQARELRRALQGRLVLGLAHHLFQPGQDIAHHFGVDCL